MMEGHEHHDMGHAHMNHNIEDHTTHQMPEGHVHHQIQGHGDHIHQTFFNIGHDVPILFSSWNLNTKTGIFLTCIGAVILGILFQGVKCLRQYIHRDYKTVQRTIKSREHLLQSLLYMIQILSSYILMLIIMTFNAWAFIATLAGLGIGYFLCGWASPKTSRDRNAFSNNCSGGCRSNKLLTTRDHKEAELHEIQEMQPLNDDMETNGECPDIGT